MEAILLNIPYSFSCYQERMYVDARASMWMYVPVYNSQFVRTLSECHGLYVFLFAREHLVLTGWDYLCSDELWKLLTYAAYASSQVSNGFKRRSFQQRSLGLFLTHALHTHSMMGLRLHVTRDNTLHHLTSPDQSKACKHCMRSNLHFIHCLGHPMPDILCHFLIGIHVGFFKVKTSSLNTQN